VEIQQKGGEARAVTPGVACDHCGWISVRGAICAHCGREVRPVADILDELTEAVINEGGSINHVKVPTELRQHLVGAMLRLRLAPRPETGVSEPVEPPRGNRVRPDNR